MNVRNNYNECLTNLACSIRKYFELEYNHNTLEYIDSILEKSNPKNVVMILFDGMGSRILDRTLDDDSFFIQNRYKEITTVFPATTTAATTSIRTGFNPVEHGWLGWTTYIKPINKTISLFLDSEKDNDNICEEYLEIKKTILKPKFITKEINNNNNNNNKYKAIELFPFGENRYNGLDDMISKIKEECSKDGRKYIYAYDDEPDHTMHDYGPDSEIVKKLIQERNDKIRKMCDELDDAVVFIVADHGHIKVDNIDLTDYTDITELLERTTSLEPRATSFKVKDGMLNIFEERFNFYFKDYFKLYKKEEIIKSKLFGDGIENPIFYDAIGDYISIAEESNKALLYGDHPLVSQHAGYTDDEIYVPLIIVKKKV